MSAHPDKDLLAAHASGDAPADRRAGLDEHLAGCAECRRELDALKAVSKMVKDLPQAELPVGFMARLERRRRAEEEGPAVVPALPWSPWRLAGFTATGLLVGLVFFREVRYRLAPEMLGTAAMDAGDTGIVSDKPADFMEAEVRSERRALASRGAWNGLQPAAPPEPAAQAFAARAEADSAAPAGEASPLAAPAPAFTGASLKREGAPIGANAYATNEQIQADLERQKAKMGIREVVPPSLGSSDPSDGLPDRPMNKDEAMGYMRQMTSRLARLNADANAKKRPTVNVGRGATPRLLGKADASAPLEEKAASLAAGAAAGGGGAGSLAMVRGAKGARVDEPASFDPPALRRPPEAAGLPGRADIAQSLADAKAAAPRPLVPRGFWSATLGGLGTDGGAVITNATDWADLWRRLGRAEPLPSVDFDKEMAVAVFAARREDLQRAVEVVSLVEEAGALKIRYRVKEEAAKSPSAPYHVVVAPKSALPFEFLEAR